MTTKHQVLEAKTFEWNGATFCVERETTLTGIRAEYVADVVSTGEVSYLERRAAIEYGTLVASVTIINGDPGFAIPSFDDDPQEIKAGHKSYLYQSREFRSALNAARIALMTDVNNPDLTPGIKPKRHGNQAYRRGRLRQLGSADKGLMAMARVKLNIPFSSAALDGEASTKDPLADGFHYPLDYILRTWLAYERWGFYPNGLPFDEQDPRLLADFETLDRRYADIFNHLAEDENWLPATLMTDIPIEAPEPPPVTKLSDILGWRGRNSRIDGENQENKTDE